MAGHMLKTVNPEAAALAEQEGLPLPGIGDTVIYCPRPGEVRRGRTQVPAIVVWRDEANRRLDLAIIHEAADMLDQRGVPERAGENERGWIRKEPDVAVVKIHHDAAELAALRADIDKLRTVVLGGFETPDTSVLDLLDAMDERLGKIEEAKPADENVTPLRQPKPAKMAKAEKPRRRFGSRKG